MAGAGSTVENFPRFVKLKMCSTLKRTPHAVAEWGKVFTCQATETYTGSVTFMKQLTIVAVSTITYMKNAFPENNYTIDQFGGIEIRALKKKCDDELAQFLITALTQAFEALDKKYLHQLALCFYSERCCPESLLEYHLFEYEYAAGAGAALSVRSAARGRAEASATFDAVRDRTKQLLRACTAMVSNTRLPETYDVSLRLYYNDDAPEDYQVPGFSAAEDAGADEVTRRTGSIKLGSVSTPFHRLQLRTYHRDNTAEESESESTTVLSQQSDVLANSECSAATGEARAPPLVLCECRRDDALEHMLLCRWCGCAQHAACYGVRAGPPGPRAPPAAHCCVQCAEPPASRFTAAVCADEDLMRTKNRTCYAIFRRALWLVYTRAAAAAAAGRPARVSAGAVDAALALGAANARKLLSVLRAHGILAQDPPIDPESEVDVVPSQLEAALARYFRAPPSPRSAPGGSQATAQSQEGAATAPSPPERASPAAAAALAPSPPPPPPASCKQPPPPTPASCKQHPRPASRKRQQPHLAPRTLSVRTRSMKKCCCFKRD